MGRSSFIPVERARLSFTNNSLRNNVIQCDALGIHYQLSTPTEGVKNKRVTTISRWDARQEKDVVIAEYERKIIGKDRIRLSSGRPLVGESLESEEGFVSLQEYIRRTYGIPGDVHVNRTFAAGNGQRYVWKSRHFSLKLYEEGSDIPIAAYSGPRLFSRRKPFISIAPSCEGIFDDVVVTCVISERKRRDAQKRNNSGGG